MTNNDILKKLRVALHLRNDQIQDILRLTHLEISTTELSAFFRAEDHRNYRPCGDQVLRHFLDGLIIFLRGQREGKEEDGVGAKDRPRPEEPVAEGGSGALPSPRPALSSPGAPSLERRS